MSIKRAYKNVYRKKLSIEDALTAIEQQGDNSNELVVFTDSVKNSTRGIIR